MAYKDSGFNGFAGFRSFISYLTRTRTGNKSCKDLCEESLEILKFKAAYNVCIFHISLEMLFGAEKDTCLHLVITPYLCVVKVVT